jgi:hypothetical protein
MMNRAAIRLVRRDKEHPYVIEITTPGGKGCDHTSDATVKQTMPPDLREICDVLGRADVKYYSVSEPKRAGVMIFMSNGTTNLVLRDDTDFGTAITALVRAGWLSPKTTHEAIQ